MGRSRHRALGSSMAPGSSRALVAVERLLRDACGFRFGTVQRRSLADAVERRMTIVAVDSAAEYLRLLKASQPTQGELAELLAEFTNTETHFFRHGGRFDLLRLQVLPQLVKHRPPGSKLRILSAGCSSGEEVYSAIMTLLEIESSWRDYEIEVVGCDINRLALERARQATYGKWTLRYTPEHLLHRYFRPLDETGKRWSVVERVTRHSTFLRRNLVDPRMSDDPTMQGFDVIFCCNVMIYLGDDIVEQLMDRLCDQLDERGFLFVGYTESLHARRRDFEPIWCDDYVVYRRRAGAAATPDPRCPPVKRPATPRPVPGPRAQAPKPPPVERAAPAAPSASDQDIASWYAEALEHCRSDRQPEALTAVERILNARPFHVRGRLLRAYLYGSRGEFWSAVAECTKALDIDPLFAQAYLLLGMLLEQQGEVDSALLETKRALFLDPELPLANYTLGKLYRSLEMPAAAAREFANTARLLETRPGIPLAGDIPVEFDRTVLLQLARKQADGATER